MEYFRDPKNQIYADLAYRLGKIINQYEKKVMAEDKYIATLYIAVLQNLSTNCDEYIKQMTKGIGKDTLFKKHFSEAEWGIDESCWVKNTFNEERNLKNFINKIRNSVSHPTATDLHAALPSTGYSTIKDGSGIIKKFRFINSPDSSKNRPKQFDTEERVKSYIKNNKSQLPDDISYTEKPMSSNKMMYILTSNSEIFGRISIIEMTVEQLGVFVKKLTNYLAQPIQINWDGETIEDLIAA